MQQMSLTDIGPTAIVDLACHAKQETATLPHKTVPTRCVQQGSFSGEGINGQPFLRGLQLI